MKLPIYIVFFLQLWFALTALSGCDAPKTRCTQCGMFVDIAPTWRAGAQDAAGSQVSFDSPKCLFRWLGSERGRGARSAWVTEYYTQRRIEISAAEFVVGSDVQGPMGADLVPLDTPAAAQRFLGEHHGTRIVKHNAVGADLLRDLR